MVKFCSFPALLLASGAAMTMSPHVAMAKRIGTIAPYRIVSAARIPEAPAHLRAKWQAYLETSAKHAVHDKQALAAETVAGVPVPPSPADGNGLATMPLDRDAAWYRTSSALEVADTIMSFQTPSGGWGKNMPRNVAPRLPGQHYVHDASPAAGKRSWDFVGTIDNGATTTELSFLARVVEAGDAATAARYGKTIARGIEYLLAAQMPNGGWPQVWPLAGGYHDALTYNDDAMVRVMGILLAAAEGQGGFASLPAHLREKSRQAVADGITCLLDTQIVHKGQRTGWAQQYDALTLVPDSARNYEPVALASSESSRILLFLMAIPEPSPEVQAAVQEGVGWLQRVAITDRIWDRAGGDPQLVVSKGARLLWARFYSIPDNTPVFGDRDRALYDDVRDISPERRRGYSWYNSTPASALASYGIWQKRIARGEGK